MAEPKPKPLKVKGGKLNKKVGPLPLKYWLGIAAGIGLILFLYFRSKSSGGNTVEGESIPLNPYQISPQQSASAGTPSPNTPVSSQLSPDVLAALGIGMPTGYITGTDLQSQLDTVSSNLAAQIAQATFTSTDSTTTRITDRDNEAISTPTVVKRATATPVKKSAAPAKAAIKYFSFAPGKAPKNRKGDEIKAVKGKTIKFAKGKGYYYG